MKALTRTDTVRSETSGKRSRSQWFWSLYAKGYDTSWDSPITAEIVRAMSGLDGVRKVVDLGCGTGLLSSQLTEAGAFVTGVDASCEMIERAFSMGRISVGVQSDAADTGLESGSFDVAICGNLLHLHHDPHAVIAESVRLVEDGRSVIFVTPTQGLTNFGALRADINSGRGVRSSLAAHLIRTIIGPAAWIAGIHVRPAEEVLSELKQATEFGLETQRVEVIQGTQILVMMRKVMPTNGGELGI